MSIRLKLGITYIICVLLSAGVIVFAIFAGAGSYFQRAASVIIEDSSVEDVITEAIDILADLRQQEQYKPEALIDSDYQKTINDRLSVFNSGLVVLYQGQYSSPMDIPLDRAEFILKPIEPEIGHGPRFRKDNNNSFSINDKNYIYFNYYFNINDEEVIYFVVMDITEINDFNTTIRRGVGGAILALILLMSLPLVLLIQFLIIKPLKSLEKGAYEIRKGNLDYQVKSGRKDEVDRAIISYEKMRKELKKSIEKQVKYENNRKELISSISHDLKTPMTSIKGYVEGILDGVANTDEKRDRYLRVIHQKSLDMDKLIDDLFTFSKLDLNKLPFEFVKVDMEEFIRDYTEQIKMEYSAQANIHLTYTSISDSRPVVKMDIMQIRRVLQNLIQNAVKYNTSDYKDIEITLKNTKEQVMFTIKDNGIGMTEDELKQAFDMFYRSDDSRNTKTGGSGLGLAIVKHIIDEHNGHIIAKSNIDHGTTITVELNKEASDGRE